MKIQVLTQRLKAAVLSSAALLVMVMLMVLSADPAHADDEDDFVSDEVVVKLNPTSGATIDEVNADYGTTTLEDLLGSRGIYLLKLPSGEDPEAVADRMELDTRLRYAEPNFTTDTPEGDRWRRWARSTTAPVPSLDPAPYRQQYALGALNLPSCANNASRGEGAVVAVLDTGVQFNHPALAGSMTSAGYDFVDDDSNPADDPNGLDDDNNGSVDELVGHGTHVAGIVDLVAPESKIMPLRVLDSDGGGNVFAIVEAIEYAAQNGADVINLSLGSSQESELLEDVLEDLAPDDEDEPAIENVPPEGIVVVAAAGNSNTEAEHYPAAHEEAIAVTSVGETSTKSEFASFGAWVDIAAPGEEIYSTFPTNLYAFEDGTSMATPFVAGQAALIRSLEPNRPSIGDPSAGEPGSVESLIKGTARSLDASNPLYAGKLGRGHADIGASLQQLRPDTVCEAPGETPNTAPTINILSPTAKTRDTTPLILATVGDKETELTKSDIKLFIDGRRKTTFSYNSATDRLNYTSQRLSRGSHKIKIVATDDQGLSTTKTLSFKIVR